MSIRIPPKPTQIFYSYSDKDEILREQLEKHLVSLRLAGTIIDWHERRIDAGKEWQEEIDKHLRTADIILLLITAEFLNSTYQRDGEMQLIIQRYEAREVKVVPVILRACDWEGMPFGPNRTLGDLKALPNRTQPVISSNRTDPDEAFSVIAKAIKEMVDTTRTTRGSTLQTPIPDTNFLPYLCDRDDQERDLLRSIKAWEKNEDLKGPLVCIVHGNDDECHLMFERRLRDITLPRHFGQKTDVVAIEDFPLNLPRHYQSDKQVTDYLQSELGRILADDGEASSETIQKALASYEQPIMLYSLLGSRDWQPNGPKLVRAFLSFWNTLPSIPPGRLIVCLLFEYKTPGASEAGVQPVNHEIRDHFLALPPVIAEYKNIQGLILPELPSIPESEVQLWISNRAYFRGFCKNHPRDFCRVQPVVQRVKETYRSRGSDIPMEPLANELILLLNQNRCQDGV